MAKRGGDRVTFEELLARSDYITVHTPLTDFTRNLIDARAFKQMKKGVRIINCARGGIINERDLYDAIKEGIVAGAALDVFEHEPPEENPLVGLDEVIATPHLGASTTQGQARVAEAIARQVKDYLEKGIVTNAVNLPSVSPEMLERVRPYLSLAEKMGSFQAQITEGSIQEVTVEYSGEVAAYDPAPITICLLKGILERALAEGVNYVNAAPIAKERGIKVSEVTTRDSEGFTSLITLRTRTKEDEHSVAGTLFGWGDPRIVRVDSFLTEAEPEGTILLMHNHDKPGVIGAIGEALGSRGINIAKMHLSRQKAEGVAISLIHVDEPMGDAVLRRLAQLENVISVRQVTL
jgi:D-3-phosphoglycerate dehydrogenase